MSMSMNPGEMWKIEYRDDESDSGQLLTNYWFVIEQISDYKWKLLFLGSEQADSRFQILSKYDIVPDTSEDTWVKL